MNLIKTSLKGLYVIKTAPEVDVRGYFARTIDKDIIKIKPVEPLKLKAGDVIFYLSGSKRLIAHRLIKKTKGKEDELLFVTKGDSTHGFDEAIPSSSVLGKVVAVERDEKEISMETKAASFKNFPCRGRLFKGRNILFYKYQRDFKVSCFCQELFNR